MDATTIPPMCGRYASFLPAEAMARIFGTVNPLPNLAPSWNHQRRIGGGDAATAQRSGSGRCGYDAAHAARSRPIWQRRICSRQYGAPRCATGAAQ
jgi:hypothetical protein